MESFMDKLPMILAVLLGLSEALAHIPSLQANSVFQLVSNFVKKAAEFFKKKEEKVEEEKEEKQE